MTVLLLKVVVVNFSLSITRIITSDTSYVTQTSLIESNNDQKLHSALSYGLHVKNNDEKYLM